MRRRRDLPPKTPWNAKGAGTLSDPRPGTARVLEGHTRPRLSALLQFGSELTQLRAVFTGVVPAEQQLAPGGEYGANLGSSPAAVAAVGSGQLGAGERGCSHESLPPSRHRGFRCPLTKLRPLRIWLVRGARWLHSLRRRGGSQCSRGRGDPRHFRFTHSSAWRIRPNASFCGSTSLSAVVATVSDQDFWPPKDPGCSKRWGAHGH